MAARAPGRPRDPALDERILAAVRRLLDAGGYAALSMEGVATEAGVAKQTLYRRWARKPLLVFDAVFGGPDAVSSVLPRQGALARDLAAVTEVQSQVYRSPGIRELVRGLLADCLGDEDLLQELRRRFLRPRLDALGAVVADARRRGEVDPGMDTDVVVEAVAGTMLFHFLLYDDGSDTRPAGAFAQGLAQLVSRGVR